MLSEEQGEDWRRQVAALWCVGLVEPLVETADRVDAERRMVRLVDLDPVWGLAWLTGLVAGVLSTLPAEDPWRHLGARWFRRSWSDPRSPLPEGMRGPVVYGPDGLFGSLADSLDVVAPVGVDDPRTDPGLAGAHRRLPVEAGVVMAAAKAGWLAAFDAAWYVRAHPRQMVDGPTSQMGRQVMRFTSAAELAGLVSGRAATDAHDMFAALSRALRSLLHRRRAYIGPDDPGFVSFAFDGFVACDRLAGRLSAEGMDVEVEAGRRVRQRLLEAGVDVFGQWVFDCREIPDGAWEELQGWSPGPDLDF